MIDYYLQAAIAVDKLSLDDIADHNELDGH